jgi:hypothetical protein
MDTPKPKKPLQQLEIICLVIAASPGLLLLTGGRVQNHAQAIFRLSVFVVGLMGFIAIKIYQHSRKEEK